MQAQLAIGGDAEHCTQSGPDWRGGPADDALLKLADMVGVHPVHLARSFRAQHGCTVGEYIRQARVRDAALRLAATDEPIASIAVACGFADQSQLTRTFKRLTGRTPGAHRALAR